MNDLKEKLYADKIKNIESNLNAYLKSIKKDSLQKRKFLKQKDTDSD